MEIFVSALEREGFTRLKINPDTSPDFCYAERLRVSGNRLRMELIMQFCFRPLGGNAELISPSFHFLQRK